MRLINDGDEFKKRQEISAHELIKLENDPLSEILDLVLCIKMLRKLLVNVFGQMNTTVVVLISKPERPFLSILNHQIISRFLEHFCITPEKTYY